MNSVLVGKNHGDIYFAQTERIGFGPQPDLSSVWTAPLVNHVGAIGPNWQERATPAEKNVPLLTAKSGVLIARKGFLNRIGERGPAIWRDTVDQVFSLPPLVQASYHQLADWISDGAVTQMVETGQAPPHVIEAHQHASSMKATLTELATRAAAINPASLVQMPSAIKNKLNDLMAGIKPSLEQAEVALTQLQEKYQQIKLEPTERGLY